MKYLYGLLLFAWLFVQQALKPDFEITGIAPLLGALCFFILKERYFRALWSTLLFTAAIFLLSLYDQNFLLLAGIALFDLVYDKRYVMTFLILLASVIMMMQFGSYVWIFHILVGMVLGFIVGAKDEKEGNFITLLDEERRLRYRLEQTQNELIQSRKEIEHLTEIRERNRIAQELHDVVGHSVAGVLFQLRGATAVIDKDRDKVKDIIALCTEKLTETLEMTRKTVYNIKTENPVGLDYLDGIIGEFKFCSVSFEHTGDFGNVSAYNMKILESNIKEALTNTARHSGATAVQIRIDVGKRNIRFYYKDNGKGCPSIKANVGISGMRRRISDAGGTISIDGNEGFMIVCNIPNVMEEA